MKFFFAGESWTGSAKFCSQGRGSDPVDPWLVPDDE